ncbi:proline-tRNA ligase, class IIa, archaeal-type [Kipferlia bialata]|uniref:proline--tRNA ligase n=1 Tax=Kipferlia bialata TaxID=797122 RepID=A0A9K3CP43_9EUKA|nr:proline-tRNA ligase, class IIa, archaeal-type [Kipferlia bialata]|eukprot:g1610.t1
MSEEEVVDPAVLAAKKAEREAKKAAKKAAKEKKALEKKAKQEAAAKAAAAKKAAAAANTSQFVVDKAGDFAEWFDQILTMADVVDKRYPVKGMDVFKPYGYYMHRNIMRMVEDEWEEQGCEHALFPSCIPQSLLDKEAEHLEGFVPEAYWVDYAGKTKLDDRLALRPTSETAMYSMFSMWIRTYRDLPLKMHQTCSVYRFETKSTKPLIRVREIPWNEAHTCHATKAEAQENLDAAWESYDKVFHGELGFWGVKLYRAPWDKFAGADHTEVLDVVMPCGRVLQTVGAHNLGQRFSKGFDIKFKDENNEDKHSWMTCYGISTRVLAAAISAHGDSKGLILPPALAQKQVVIVPIIRKTGREEVYARCAELAKELKAAGIRAHVDTRDLSPGAKFFFWEMKGVPVRVEVVAGPSSGSTPQQMDRLTDLVKRDLDALQTRLRGMDARGGKGVLARHNRAAMNALQVSVASKTHDFQTALRKHSKAVAEAENRRGAYASQSALSLMDAPVVSLLGDTDEGGAFPGVQGMDPNTNRGDPAVDERALIPAEAMSALTVLSSEAELDVRARSIGVINRTLGEISQMYRRLNMILEEQGQGLLQVDGNMDAVVENVETGQTHLERYLTRLEGSRWLMMKIVGVLFVFMLLFAFIR